MSGTKVEAEFEPFIPRRGMKSAHMQTLGGNFLLRASGLPAAEDREFQVEPDVRVLCHCHWQRDRSSALTVIIVHGLEGSGASQYVIGTGTKAWAAGMNVVRMNMRNCGGTERLGPTLYHSGLSADVGMVARALISQEKLTRVALAGFSMGGNLVLKLAGELGNAAPRELVAAAAVSPAMDLSVSVDALHLPSNRIYEWKFLWGLLRRLRRKSALFPGKYETPAWGAIHSIRDFDDKITARYCGFHGAEDYYFRASSSRLVAAIAIPALVIHSADDPFIKILPETGAKLRANPNIRYIETLRGGHCAFLAAPNGYDGRWAERQVIEFLKRF